MPAGASPALYDLAEEWLSEKAAAQSTAQTKKGNSDRARRSDLARWGVVLRAGKGLPPFEEGAGRARYDLATAMGGLEVQDLAFDPLRHAMTAAKAAWANRTVIRMTSTLRGLVRALVRRGYLDADPFTVDPGLLRAPDKEETREDPHALGDGAYEAILAEAAKPPPGRSRQYWPERDVAIVRFLATTGARAEELCSARIRDFDETTERVTIWMVDESKGSKPRDVAVPGGTWESVRAWLEVRGHSPASAPLFCRRDGEELSTSALDHLLRGLAARAGRSFPPNAAAHSFRHRYGTVRAELGVRDEVLGELMGHRDPRTTRIYTKPGRAKMISALDEAGLLGE